MKGSPLLSLAQIPKNEYHSSALSFLPLCCSSKNQYTMEDTKFQLSIGLHMYVSLFKQISTHFSYPLTFFLLTVALNVKFQIFYFCLLTIALSVKFQIFYFCLLTVALSVKFQIFYLLLYCYPKNNCLCS